MLNKIFTASLLCTLSCSSNNIHELRDAHGSVLEDLDLYCDNHQDKTRECIVTRNKIDSIYLSNLYARNTDPVVHEMSRSFSELINAK